MSNFTIRKRDRECSLWYCGRKHSTGGFCPKHYQNVVRFREPIAPSSDDLRTAVTEGEKLVALVDELSADDFTHEAKYSGESVCVLCGGAAGAHAESCLYVRLKAQAERMKSEPPMSRQEYIRWLREKNKSENHKEAV
jgi:hypothetical protein